MSLSAAGGLASLQRCLGKLFGRAFAEEARPTLIVMFAKYPSFLFTFFFILFVYEYAAQTQRTSWCA